MAIERFMVVPPLTAPASLRAAEPAREAEAARSRVDTVTVETTADTKTDTRTADTSTAGTATFRAALEERSRSSFDSA
jgi:hypothetical protein